MEEYRREREIQEGIPPLSHRLDMGEMEEAGGGGGRGYGAREGVEQVQTHLIRQQNEFTRG